MKGHGWPPCVHLPLFISLLPLLLVFFSTYLHEWGPLDRAGNWICAILTQLNIKIFIPISQRSPCISLFFYITIATFRKKILFSFYSNTSNSKTCIVHSTRLLQKITFDDRVKSEHCHNQNLSRHIVQFYETLWYTLFWYSVQFWLNCPRHSSGIWSNMGVRVDLVLCLRPGH